MTELDSKTKKAQGGNAVIIVLVVLAVVAVGALAYLSGQMTDEPASTTNTAAVEANNMTDVETTETAEAEAATEMSDAAAESETAPVEGEETVAVTETTDTAETDAPAAEAEGSDATPTAIDPGNPVVAKVGDEDVTRLDVLNFITQLPPNISQMPIEQLFPVAQEQVINSKIVEKNIDTSSVENSEAVQKQIEMAREQIVRAAYLEQEVEKKLTEQRLKSAYDEFVKKQPDVEEAKAAHILVDDEQVAKDIIAKLNNGGDFAELAKEHSKDNTAENGGDLGYFAKSDVVPEFADAAFALSNGSYTKEPVQSQFGYHVIRLDEKRMRPKPTFEEAESFLRNEQQRLILDEMLQKWRESTKIEKFDINGKPVAATEGE